MAVAIFISIAVLLVLGGVLVLRQVNLNKAIAISEMEEVPFFISTLITVTYEPAEGDAASYSTSRDAPYQGTNSLLVRRADLNEICQEAGLTAHPFVTQALASEFVLVSLQDLVDWQAIYTKTPPNNYVYSFTRGPDYENAQRHLPDYLQGFHSHVSGDLNKWATQTDLSESIAYTIELTSVAGEVFTIGFALDALDPSRVKREVEDFELVTVVPDFVKIGA